MAQTLNQRNDVLCITNEVWWIMKEIQWLRFMLSARLKLILCVLGFVRILKRKSISNAWLYLLLYISVCREKSGYTIM